MIDKFSQKNSWKVHFSFWICSFHLIQKEFMKRLENGLKYSPWHFYKQNLRKLILQLFPPVCLFQPESVLISVKVPTNTLSLQYVYSVAFNNTTVIFSNKSGIFRDYQSCENKLKRSMYQMSHPFDSAREINYLEP